MTRYLFILSFYLLAFWSGSLQAVPIVIGPDTDGVWLGKNLEILKDSQDRVTFEDLRLGNHTEKFFTIPRDVPTLGYFNGNTYWARFTLHNPTDQPIEIYLASRYATTDYLTLYWLEPGGDYKSLALGDCVAFSKRPVESRYPVFPITVPTGSHTYYLHMKTTTAIQFFLSISTPKKFWNYESRESSYVGLLFGVCFAMFFYNFFVALKFRSRAYAAYVLYIFFYILFTSIYHGDLQQYVFPHMENGWIFKNFIFITIELISLSCATFSIEFLNLKQSAPRLYRVLFWFRIVFALNLVNWLTLGLAAKQMTLIGNFFFCIMLIGIGAYRSFSYRPARYYTMGWSIFLSSNLVMLLGNNGIISSTVVAPLAQFTGAALELVLLSLALGDRVSLINSERQESLLHQQKLQEQLIQSERERTSAQDALLQEREEHIRNLDRIVFERTRDIKSILTTINQGILTIDLQDGNLQVGPEYSQYLNIMLATGDIQKQDPIQLIFAHSNLSSEVIDQTRQILFSCIGDPEFSYEVNRAHLIREVILSRADGAALYIEIDWLPVLSSEEKIDKILVILRDVTQLRILREQTRAKEHELLMTGELTSKQGRKFPNLYSRTIDTIKHHCQQAKSQSEMQPLGHDEHKVILRFLHTLKGDARVFGLRTLAQCVHDSESYMLSQGSLTYGDVLRVMPVIEELLHQYNQIWRERLGFQQDAEYRPLIPADLVSRIFRYLEDMIRLGAPGSHESPANLYSQLNQAFAFDLESVLQDQLRNLKSMAAELNKAPPLFVFQGQPCAIPEDCHTRLGQAFGHLLANSLDHGIEDKAERLKQGKPEQASILFIQDYQDGVLRITYSDDGRGLNIGALQSKARNLRPGSETKPEEAAEMIFLTGLSTSQTVSMISGRGIGMSAVRELLESIGGRIHIKLGEPKNSDKKFYAFAFVITLPLLDSKRIPAAVA